MLWAMMELKTAILAMFLSLAPGLAQAQGYGISRVEGYVHVFTSPWGRTFYFLTDDFGRTYGLPHRSHRQRRQLQRHHFYMDRMP